MEQTLAVKGQKNDGLKKEKDEATRYTVLGFLRTCLFNSIFFCA